MKPAILHRLFGKRSLSTDQSRVQLVFLVGIIGQILVFLIPDPLRILAPQVPMLTTRDWPGSRIGTKIFFTDNWRMKPTDPYSTFQWEEKRGFYQSLYLSENNVLNTSIDQTIIWYADPGENAEVWNQKDPDAFNGWRISERNMEPDESASILACNPGLPPQCWYLAYWGHWFTGVFFWRQEDEDLLLQDIHQLTPRIDQMLIAAPDEPCFWFLCTRDQSLEPSEE